MDMSGRRAPSAAFDTYEERDDVTVGEAVEEVDRLLREGALPMTQSELAEALRLPILTVLQALDQLVAERRVSPAAPAAGYAQW